jgi:hypothetical protein
VHDHNTLKLPHHRNFEATPSPIIAVHVFQNLVQSFSQERPETVQRAKVRDLLWDVDRPVEVWFTTVCAIQLAKYELKNLSNIQWMNYLQKLQQKIL